MNNVNFLQIFDIIVVFLGAYIIFQSVKMRSDNEVPGIFMTGEEMRLCTNKKGLINYLYSRALAFGAVDVLFGLAGLYNDFIYKFSDAVNAALVIIFLAVWVWFSLCLRKAKTEFF